MKIIIINDTTLVRFNKSYIIKDFSEKQDITTNLLIDYLKLPINDINIKTYDKICLIKSTITKNQNPINKSFSNDYNDYFKNKGFEIIIPENFDIKTLFKIIYNAKYIVFSWGCCSYLNSIFVNINSNVLILCHKGYEIEYNKVITYPNDDITTSSCFPKICNKKLILYDLETEINDIINQNLDIKINELLD
jgi:hypothetical protein